MEAYGGMSAVVTERAGSKGLRTSGLSISCLLGDRDTCEASWTQLVNVVERMADLTELPVLADGDSGFGRFNDARLLAPELPRGAGVVALEEWMEFHVNSRK